MVQIEQENVVRFKLRNIWLDSLAKSQIMHSTFKAVIHLL